MRKASPVSRAPDESSTPRASPARPGDVGGATGAWRAVPTADGSWTLAHPVHGESCHSTSGAWGQARERYAQGCRLAERAREIAARGGAELALLDVGTGLGLNLAAALEALEGTGVRLRAVSLELDPTVVEAMLALAHSAATPDARTRSDSGLERWHRPVRAALATACREPARAASAAGLELADGTLRLLWGDARGTLRALPEDERFDAVFLDGFSPRVDPALWEPAFLAEIARRMAPSSWLATYSAAVEVRLGLFAAGLRVGPGPRVAAKAEGTLASPDREPPAFPPRLARRLARRLRSRPDPSSAGPAARIRAPDADSGPPML